MINTKKNPVNNTTNVINSHVYIQPVICHPRRKMGFNIDPFKKKENHNHYRLKCEVSNAREMNTISNEIQNSLKNKQKENDHRKKEELINSYLEKNDDNIIRSNNTISFDLNPINVTVNLTGSGENNDLLDNSITFNLKINKSTFEDTNNTKNYDSLIDDLYDKNIQTINNVYRESYTDNVKVSGFGDFVRGCYFLIFFCEKYGFDHNIIVDHPVSQFLENSHYFNMNYKYIFDKIPIFSNNNWINSTLSSNNEIVHFNFKESIIPEFIDYLNNTTIYDSNLFIYNICFPSETIPEKHKSIMRSILEPNSEMKNYINNTLKSLNLNKKNYYIIHIRSGDKYLNNMASKFDMNYIHTIIEDISKYASHKYPFLLISDNNYIKQILTNVFPFIKTIYKEITHFGEGVKLEYGKVKNTMLDFYLFSMAKRIKSYSSYEHGSGFSYWSSITYNVPYSCKVIK